MSDASTDQLIHRASAGDSRAAQALLEKHRGRLRQMVDLRMEDGIKARVDASDVVQETMIEASRQLANYLKEQPLPFYPWLRQIAAERLEKLHRRHIGAQKRSVRREAAGRVPLNDQSSVQLIEHLMASGTSPSRNLLRKERSQFVQTALLRLEPVDQEILVLRHLEQLSISEIAAILRISETAAKSRHFRAIHRLHHLLGDDFSRG